MDRIQETSFRNIRVAFNNAYIYLVSQIEAVQVICMQIIIYVFFEDVLRNNIFNIIRRLESCTTSIIQFLIQSSFMKFEVWKHWLFQIL